MEALQNGRKQSVGGYPPPLNGSFLASNFLFNESFLFERRTCLQFLETGQIGATATTTHVKLGKATVTMIMIVREAQFAEQTTARTFGHRPFMELIAALQTHSQVSRVLELG